MPTLLTLMAGTMIATIAAVAGGTAENVAVAASFVPPMLIAGYQAFAKDKEIFHPVFFVFLTVFFGITVQTFYLVYLDDGSHKFGIGTLTDGRSLLFAILAVAIGVFALLIGYASGRSRRIRQSRSQVPEGQWSEGRVRVAVIVCLGIGLVALAYYASVFNIMENITDQFAVKRRIVEEDGVSRTLSWVRFAVNFSQLAFFVAFAHYLRSPRRSSTLKMLVVVSALAGIALPFIASSRLGILTFLLGAVMIHHFSTGGWPVKRLKLIALVVFSIMIGMGTLRYVQTRGITYTDYGDAVSLEKVLEPVLGSSNFLAVGKTAVVLEAVPEAIDYQYGRTYGLWLLAPIPRALWPDKPVIRIGAVLGEAIFGTSLRGGVPPGVIGELYFNFSWVGIPFGMFLMGLAFRRFYDRFGIGAYDDVSKCVIYSSVLVFLAFTGLSADFSGMMSLIIQRVVPLLLILRFVAASRSSRSFDTRGSADTRSSRKQEPARRLSRV